MLHRLLLDGTWLSLVAIGQMQPFKALNQGREERKAVLLC